MCPPDKLGLIGIIDTPLHNASLHHRRTEIRFLNLMRLIFSKNMMLIYITHGMEIIVGHIILVEAECHGGTSVFQSCRNALSIFIRIIPGYSRFQEFLLDIIRHIFCRHDMEDISDRKGWLMLEAFSIAAIHVSAHIAGDGLPSPGSIRGTGVCYAHLFAIWLG